MFGGSFFVFGYSDPITGIGYLHSCANQPIWRTTLKFRRSTDGIIYGNSFVYKHFSSNRGINADGLLTNQSSNTMHFILYSTCTCFSPAAKKLLLSEQFERQHIKVNRDDEILWNGTKVEISQSDYH